MTDWHSTDENPPYHVGWFLLAKPGEYPPRPFWWRRGQWWTGNNEGDVQINAAGLIWTPCPAVPPPETQT